MREDKKIVLPVCSTLISLYNFIMVHLLNKRGKTIYSGFIRKTGIAFIAILFTAFTTHSALAQNWELVWSDEFEGTELDLTKWTYQIGRGANYGIPNWGNNELQYYTDSESNLYLEDGKLHIRAMEEQMGTANYTSARIRSIYKGDWTYGKFVARAKLPKGQGLWPAIWMMPTESVYGGWPQSGEIDIMELVGHEPDVVHGTVHYGPPWPDNLERSGSTSLSEGTFNDDFHEFKIIWTPSSIRWFLDDNLYFMVTPGNLSPHNWPFDQDFHWILNVAVGGNWPGNPDGTTEFPQEMIIDYVRVYQDTELVSTEEFGESPDEFKLNQNYPNPFNPSTSISFELPQTSHVDLRVYDVMGREVAAPANGTFSAGSHTVSFDASNLSSGTYIYRLVAGEFQQSRTMLLVK